MFEAMEGVEIEVALFETLHVRIGNITDGYSAILD